MEGNGQDGSQPFVARRRLTPPVGFPFVPGELVTAWRASLNPTKMRRRARRALADAVGLRRVWFTSSGRSAMYLTLQAFAAQRPERTEVVLPAYACYSIASVILRAGLTPRLVDLEENGFGFDPDRLAATVGDGTLAVIVPHLLGFPDNLQPIEELAEKHGFWVIDDAAQALGARRRARHCGAGGHVGVFSFGRGKPITSLGGGALTCDDPELMRILEPTVEHLDRAPRFSSIRTFVAAGLYSLVLRPNLYWLPAGLPFLGIGITEFDFDFAIRGMPSFKQGLIRAGLRRIDQVNECRRRVAERLERSLADVPTITLIQPAENAYATYLRFPILFDSREQRRDVEERLRHAGIGAGPLYPRSLNQTPELESRTPDHGHAFPRAERMARGLCTVPTFPFVTHDDVERIASVVRGGKRRGAPTGAAAIPAAEAVGS